MAGDDGVEPSLSGSKPEVITVSPIPNVYIFASSASISLFLMRTSLPSLYAGSLPLAIQRRTVRSDTPKWVETSFGLKYSCSTITSLTFFFGCGILILSTCGKRWCRLSLLTLYDGKYRLSTVINGNNRIYFCYCGKGSAYGFY